MRRNIRAYVTAAKSTWAMMLLGFGAVSLAMRLNRRKMKVIPQVA